MSARVRLTDRCLLRLSGDGGPDFLNSLLTNSINPKGICYAALLTPQGRVLYDLFVVDTPTGLVLDVARTTSQELQQTLQRYILRRPLVITAIDELAVFSSFTPPQELAYQDPRHPDLGWRLYAPSTPEDEDLSSYSHRRIALGIPDPFYDSKPGQDFALDLNLDLIAGVSFSKGCYIGQEVTARMKHRGLIKRRLVRLYFPEKAPAAGSPISGPDGEAVLRSQDGGHLALAVLPVHWRGQSVCCDGQMPEIKWID